MKYLTWAKIFELLEILGRVFMAQKINCADPKVQQNIYNKNKKYLNSFLFDLDWAGWIAPSMKYLCLSLDYQEKEFT